MWIFSVVAILHFTLIDAKNFMKSYCDMSCQPGLKHTMCMFSKENAECENLKITPEREIKDDILSWHNKLRHEFFESVPTSSLPLNNQVKMLSWDDELEEMAKRWVSQCEPTNDRCRTLSRFEVGQNVGLLTGNVIPPDSSPAFAQWAKPMDPKFSSSTQKLNFLNPAHRKTLQQFFQMISPEIYLLGCAEATYQRGDLNYRLLVCNYGPLVKTNMENIYAFIDPVLEARAEEYRKKQLQQLREQQAREQEMKILHGMRGLEETDWVLELGYEPYTDWQKLPSSYCNIDCSGKVHVMCTPEKQPSEYSNVQMTDDTTLKRCIIGRLNTLRNWVAGGHSVLPSAADMRMLVWDKELARIAKRWARECPTEPDSCRNVERFPVNQFVMIFSSNLIGDESHCSEFMDTIADRVPELDESAIGPYVYSSHNSIHFVTQALWSKSSRIGCAEVLFDINPKSRYEHETEHRSSLVCNIGEGGNQFGHKVYEIGTPCTRCPPGTSCKNKRFPFLCTEDTPGSGGRSLSGKEHEKYCSIKCVGQTHIMCIPESGAKTCNSIKLVDNDDLKKCALPALNYLRNEIASGSSGLPGASNMRLLAWDDELEMLAERWAKECPARTDGCRDVGEFVLFLGEVRFPVNQLVLMSVATRVSNASRCIELMSSITKLVASLGKDVIEFYSVDPDDPLRYLTQVIWAKSSRVGCAEVLFYKGPGLGDSDIPDEVDVHVEKYSTLVCNFGEGGNVMNEPVYSVGPPCSQCPVGTSCNGLYFPNLCAEDSPNQQLLAA